MPTCLGATATITGTGAAETLTGTPGADVIVGLGGNDVIDGKGGNDRICGGSGADIIYGRGGADRVNGGAGNDTLIGGAGRDTLNGGPGTDRATGGAGTDTCYAETMVGCELPARYVSPSGDDGNPGTLGAPWRTIQHAAEELTAGETVYIRAGTYREWVRVRTSGAPGRLISFVAYRGENPVLDGTTVTLPDDQHGLFEIGDVDYIRVSGLRVVNAGPHQSNGILVRSAHHIRLESNEIFDTAASGIGVWWSGDVVVTGNEVVRACTGGYQEALSVAGTDGFEIAGNVVHDSSDQEGICIKDGSMNGTVHDNLVFDVPEVGIYVDAWDTPRTSGISIYRNIVHDTMNGILTASETGGFLEDVSIFNNLVYRNEYYGIAVTRNGTAPRHPARGITIVNNTVWNNGYAWGGGIAVDNPDATEVVVRNNIVSGNLSFQLALSGDVPAGAATFDHNLVDGYRGNPEGEIYGDDHVEGDPLFVDPSGGDFHLRAGSPAVDAGSADEAPGWDFDGVPRPQGGAVDIGAYERPAENHHAGGHPTRWQMW